MIPEKLCVFCKHWKIREAELPWSTLTGGSPANMICKKAHWLYEEFDDEADFRAVILQAADCEDYEIAVDEA